MRLILGVLFYIASFILVGQEKIEIELPIGIHESIYSLNISPDGKRVLSTSDASPNKVWDLSSGRILQFVDDEPSNIAKYTPDGSKIVKQYLGGIIRVYDASNTGIVLKSIKVTEDWIENFTISPDGNLIAIKYSENDEGKAGVWNIISGKQVSELHELSEYEVITEWSSDSKLIMSEDLTNFRSKSVLIRKANSGKVCFKNSGRACTENDSLRFKEIGEELNIVSFGFSKTKNLFYLSLEEGITEVYSLNNFKLQSSFNNASTFRDNSLSPSGDILISSCFLFDYIELLNIVSGERTKLDFVNESQTHRAVSYFEWSDDSEFLFAILANGTIVVFDTKNGDKIKEIEYLFKSEYDKSGSNYVEYIIAHWIPTSNNILVYDNHLKKGYILNTKDATHQPILNGSTVDINRYWWSKDEDHLLYETEFSIGSWNLLEGKLDYQNNLKLLRVFPNGNYLAVNKRNEFSLWDSQLCDSIDSYKGLSGNKSVYDTSNVFFNSDMLKAVTIDHNALGVWDTKKGLVCEINIPGVNKHSKSIKWTDYDSKFALTLEDTLLIFDAKTGTEVFRSTTVNSYQDLSWSPNSKYLLVDTLLFEVRSRLLKQKINSNVEWKWNSIYDESGSYIKEIDTVVVELQTGRILNGINSDLSFSYLGFDTIVVWNKDSQNPSFKFSIGKEVKTAKVILNNKQLEVTYRNKKWGDSKIIWNLQTGDHTLEMASKDILWSPDSSKVVFLEFGKWEDPMLLDVESNQIIFEFKNLNTHDVHGAFSWSSNCNKLLVQEMNGETLYGLKDNGVIPLISTLNDGWNDIFLEEKYCFLVAEDSTTLLRLTDMKELFSFPNVVYWWSDLELSSDGRFLISIVPTLISEEWRITIWDLLKNYMVNQWTINAKGTFYISWSPNNLSFLINCPQSNQVYVCNSLSGKQLTEKPMYTSGWPIWSPDGLYICTRGKEYRGVKVFRISEPQKVDSFETDFQIRNYNWIDNSKLEIRFFDDTTKNVIWDFITGETVENLINETVEKKLNNSVQASNRSLEKYVLNDNASLFVSDYVERNYNDAIVEMTAFKNGSYIMRTNNNYYSASKKLLSYLTFKVGSERYSFSQFDLKYNRPDLVLDRLGYASQETIDQYKRAYEKRLKKMGFTEDMLQADFHLPEAKVKNENDIPVEVANEELTLNLSCTDTKYPLDRINIWVNNVPIYGINGISLRSKMTQDFDTTIQVLLNEGDNKIEVSVLNQAGAESYKETVYTTCTKEAPKPNLYFVGIGVKDYADANMNLKYSDKDIKDIAEMYAKNKSYGKVYIDTFLNSSVTTDILPIIEKRLASTTIHDQVIFMYSGHGLLDENLDYYLTTHDIDFSNPSVNGLPYDQVDALLDGIPARQKLVLIDACHSGEVDKDETTIATNKEGVQATDFGKGDAFKRVEKTSNSFELMKELFTDLRRGTGATVISSSSGLYFSFEDAKYQNGIYTYALKLGLEGAADTNEDAEITVTELKDFLYEKVKELTDGKQQPNTRQENLEYDYRVW